MSFRLTYATMFDPPEAMHQLFDAALAGLRRKIDARHALFIDGVDHQTERSVRLVSPIDADIVLGEFPLASERNVDAAMEAAYAAWPHWRRTPVSERANCMRRVADLIEARVYEIAAALALEVGKNRMEALGEAQETVDFFRCYADDFEGANGYDRPLPNDPLEAVVSTNRSTLRPYGVWAVIAPFNFPLALAGGPAAAAMITGNTVVIKSASDTPWACRLLAECVRDAGVPPGGIVAVTFTNKAAKEMRERVEKLLGPAVRELWCGTFHSVCVRILRRDIGQLGFSRGFAIYDESDSLGLIKAAQARHHIDPKVVEPRRLRWRIDAWKNSAISAAQAASALGAVKNRPPRPCPAETSGSRKSTGNALDGSWSQQSTKATSPPAALTSAMSGSMASRLMTN